jgi:anthranilate synthase component I
MIDTVDLVKRTYCQEILLDGVTPIAAYQAVRTCAPSPTFLLESAPGAGELARHSIIGLGAHGDLIAAGGVVTLRTPRGTFFFEGDRVLEATRTLLTHCAPSPLPAKHRSFLGAYGVAAFELAGYFERIAYAQHLPSAGPDLHLVVPQIVIVFDHFKHTVAVIANERDRHKANSIVACLRAAVIAPLDVRAGADQLRPVADASTFASMVDIAQAAIRAGDVFQIVLSQVWGTQVGQDPFPAYRRLRSINPSPYMFYLEFDGRTLLGSSPEMLCRVEDGEVRLRPLAGTRARPTDPQRERDLIDELRSDPKERAEHVMLVDLGRNDLGRVCEYGSIVVSELGAIERYSHVMHLVSEVRGRLRSDCDAFDLFAATFPAGTVSGAPKIRALQLIASIEGRRRGYYGGSVMRFGFDGSLDACIVLRSADVFRGQAAVMAGAGIVVGSVAEREDAECRAKAMALQAALCGDGQL